MGVEYRIDILNRSGVKVAEIGGRGKAAFLELGCDKQVNSVGLLSFTLNYEHAAVPLIADMYLVHLYRRWPEMGIPWYLFFPGIYRDDIYENRDGRDLVTFLCPGQMSMLGWRINAYSSDTTNKTKWTAKPSETVMKDLVRNNFTSIGTVANGRDRDATLSGAVNGYTITIEADALRGTIIDYASARNEVLKDLEDVTNTAVYGDFDLVKTGATTWEFRYYPLRGTDRTATVTFSTEFGNMRNPRLARQRSVERTAILVGGGGTKGGRQVRTRGGMNYNVATNDTEAFVNSATTTNGSTANAVLDAFGDKEKTKRRMRPRLDYQVAQVSASLLDKHYFMGDMVSARAFGLSFAQQIYGVGMSFAESGEEISIRTREY